MRTLIISDLHLGSSSGTEVLRHRQVRELLWRALADVERLVLLGDVLELRHGPRRLALARAQSFFVELGERLVGRELVILAGNHDHALVHSWLDTRGEVSEPPPLALAQLLDPVEASPALAQIARWTAPARVTVAYPGMWVREDVYATHGHYLDCHLTIPTLERLGIGLMSRVLSLPQSAVRSVDEYETLTAPVFAWIDAVAQRAPTSTAINGQGTVRAWRTLRGEEGDGGLRSRARRKLMQGALPAAVGVLNRAGIGELQADVSPQQLRRAGLRAMGEVVRRLGVGEADVIFGHTHRTGPLPNDDPREWRTANGRSLINCGCWTYDSYFLGSATSENPYWPGGAVLVEESGPPKLLRLLEDLGHAELAPTPVL